MTSAAIKAVAQASDLRSAAIDRLEEATRAVAVAAAVESAAEFAALTTEPGSPAEALALLELVASVVERWADDTFTIAVADAISVAVAMSEKLDPYYVHWTPETLRELFRQTEAWSDFRRNRYALKNWETRRALKDAVIGELFGRPLPRPANMASGWAFLAKCNYAVELLVESGED